MKTETWICSECGKSVEIRGYSEKYFYCASCGVKNKVTKKSKGVKHAE